MIWSAMAASWTCGCAVHELRQSNADLRVSLDSLAQVVARQDSLLRQVAVVAGIAVPAPGIPVHPLAR